MADTGVDWAEKGWSPTTGCDWTSEGCDNCYAMKLAPRLKAMERGRIGLKLLDESRARYQNDGDSRTSGPGFLATQHEFTLDAPLRGTRGYRWFINPMSDLFHKRITTAFIAKVFARIAGTPHHTYQLLSKRAGRMRVLLSSARFWELVWGELRKLQIADEVRDAALAAGGPLRNLWVGVSVENQKWAHRRLSQLARTPAAVRWVSCEPLIAPLDLDAWLGMEGVCPGVEMPGAGVERAHTVECCTGCYLDWIVVGGESGARARPMELEWAQRIQARAELAGVPFYFKQAGKVLAGKWGIKGKGNNPDDWPVVLPRQYPEPVAA